MGQAKLRGTYDQRKLEGESRKAAVEQRRRDELAAQEAAMTPGQRARRKQAVVPLAWLLGMMQTPINAPHF